MNRFVMSQLDQVNRRFEKWMEKRSREVRIPENVEEFCDIPYRETTSEFHKIDVYRPNNTGGPLPVMVNFHGGGMVLCSRKVNAPFCREMAKRGFLVFSVDYPLVPDADVPQILQDAAAGMKKVEALLEAFGGDPERVFLVGDSAGAFIGLYEMAAQKNPELAASLNLEPSGLEIRRAAFISGMFYTARFDSVGAYLRRDFYGKNWRDHPFRPYMDPAAMAVTEHLPPLYLVTSKLDHLRSYTLKLAKGLKARGKDFILVDKQAHPDMTHDFVIVKPEGKPAQEIIEGICDFFKNA